MNTWRGVIKKWACVNAGVARFKKSGSFGASAGSRRREGLEIGQNLYSNSNPPATEAASFSRSHPLLCSGIKKKDRALYGLSLRQSRDRIFLWLYLPGAETRVIREFENLRFGGNPKSPKAADLCLYKSLSLHGLCQKHAAEVKREGNRGHRKKQQPKSFDF